MFRQYWNKVQCGYSVQIQLTNAIDDDFVGAVLNGFPEDTLNYCGVPLSDVQNAYNDFLNFISQPGNINQTLQGCN